MILGFSGKALAGKDTAADYLMQTGFWQKKVSFASNLKDLCSEVFVVPKDLFYTQEGKRKKLKNKVVFNDKHLDGIIYWLCKTHKIDKNSVEYNKFFGQELYTPRDILQFVGTDVIRSYCDGYHVDVVFLNNNINTDNIIITDVRFMNEVEGVLNNNGFVVRIERIFDKCSSEFNTGHLSETSLDSFDRWSYILNNPGDLLENFYIEIDKMVKNTYIFSEEK